MTDQIRSTLAACAEFLSDIDGGLARQCEAAIAALEASSDTPIEAHPLGLSEEEARLAYTGPAPTGIAPVQDDEPMLTADEEAELVERINANPNLQPVQDDDAEWLLSFQVRSQRTLQDGDVERFAAIANRLTPSADHSLVEELRRIAKRLYDYPNSDYEAHEASYALSALADRLDEGVSRRSREAIC